MAEMVLTKKTFIGGRLAYPGEKVDIDAKGGIVPAHSTPVGSLTIEQIEAVLEARRREGGDPEKVEREPDLQFGSNVAEPSDENTGVQEAGMAPFRPHAVNPTHPQGIPPGTVPQGDSFIRPAPEGAPAAIEEIVPARSPLDHDGDGHPGGSLPADPPGLAGKTKAQLLDIAKDEGAEADDGMTNAQIVQAIEAKRAGS